LRESKLKGVGATSPEVGRRAAGAQSDPGGRDIVARNAAIQHCRMGKSTSRRGAREDLEYSLRAPYFPTRRRNDRRRSARAAAMAVAMMFVVPVPAVVVVVGGRGADEPRLLLVPPLRSRRRLLLDHGRGDQSDVAARARGAGGVGDNCHRRERGRPVEHPRQRKQALGQCSHRPLLVEDGPRRRLFNAKNPLNPYQSTTKRAHAQESVSSFRAT
jgi:hypothetical protein